MDIKKDGSFKLTLMEAFELSRLRSGDKEVIDKLRSENKRQKNEIDKLMCENFVLEGELKKHKQSKPDEKACKEEKEDYKHAQFHDLVTKETTTLQDIVDFIFGE